MRDKHQQFCRERGITRWAHITKGEVERYGKWLESNGYADRSVYLELTLVKQLLKWLIGEGHLPASLQFQLPLHRPSGTDTFCYSAEQVQAMVDHCRATEGLEWMGSIIVALATTGLRISELASLRRTDFDAAAMMLSLTDERGGGRRQRLGIERRTKGRRSRHVPVHPELCTVIQGLPVYSDGRLFHGPNGGKVKPDTIRNVLRRDVIAALKVQFPTPVGEIGFEHGHVHSFRHFFVSEAFRHGASEGEIMGWTGHRESKMVAHYRHLRPRDSQRTLTQIPFVRFSAAGVPHAGDAVSVWEASSSAQTV